MKQPRITAFRFPVPKELVGDFLEWAHLHAAGGLTGIEPIFESPSSARSRQLSDDHRPPPALASPNGQITQLLPDQSSVLRPPGMSAKEFFYRLIAKYQPIDRMAIGQHAKPAGFSPNYVTQTLKLLRDQGAIVSTNGGPYSIGKTPPGPFHTASGGKPRTNGAHAPTPAHESKNKTDPEANAPSGAARVEPQTDTHDGKLLRFVRAQKGKQISYAEMKTAFLKLKLRAESAGIALLTLRTKGFVKRVGPALYEYVP